MVIPTRGRPEYLAVALASIAPQAEAAGAEVVVVDDGVLERNASLARDYGASYIPLDPPRGLNAARNAGLDAARGELIVYVDDDVEVRDGWLGALLAAAREHAQVGVFTGPVHARLEGRALRSCGQEGPPITSLELGTSDRDATRAWGVNMAIRRTAFDAIGPFDPRRSGGGDEEEWERRHLAAGGRIRYIAAAALDHRRAPQDATLRALMRSAHRRGIEARHFDAEDGSPPPLRRELRVLAGCLWHTARRRCENGLVMAAHSTGRVRAARRPAPPLDDFLSGRSGTVGGRRDLLRSLGDAALDLASAPLRRRIARRAARGPKRRVLALCIARPELRASFDAAAAELRRSHHDVELAVREPAGLGKFEGIGALLAEHPPEGYDWLLLFDDDVELPQGFLDGLLFVAEQFELKLVQPAHRLLSHAAWRLTRRHAGAVARETAFVEIGPLTALHHDSFATLLPLPALRMGWGLDAHWAALARQAGLKLGIVDALPIAHRVQRVGAAYAHADAIAEARAFLAEHSYLPASESQRTLRTHRRCA